MNYAPPGVYLWDTWFMPQQDQVHCFHLVSPELRPDADSHGRDWRWIGHAVSHDLVSWETLSPALGPDETNPQDNGQPWTGCALWHAGRGYLFYTMHPLGGMLEEDRIGLATSADGIHWQRWPSNPVITPDERWYATLQGPVPGSQRCRDLSIIADPEGGWFGFYAARLNERGELPELNCVACVHTDDLVHWQHRPPAFTPRKYCTSEVTEVFRLDGRYYLTLLTGHNYGNRGLFRDPYVTTGTIYAVSERPEGPYEEPTNNILLGANQFGPLSARTVEFEGQRWLFYSDHERYGATDSGHSVLTGTLTTPKRLVVQGERLAALYCDRIERRVTTELAGPQHPPGWLPGPARPGFPEPLPHWQDEPDGSVVGDIRSGVDERIAYGTLDDGILEVEITLERGKAGLAFRLDQGGFWQGFGGSVVLDAYGQVIEYQEEADFDIYRETRRVLVRRGVPMHLRVVLRREHIEAYLDDVLYLSFPRYRYGIGGFGLVIDRARAIFRGLRVRRLDVQAP